jgi:hypothetical protein
MRHWVAVVALLVSTAPALADGWRYDSGPSALLPKGQRLHMLSNGAAMFMCAASLPLTFGVEISYDTRDLTRKLPPAKVTWLVDDTVGETASWSRQGLFVLADPRTSHVIAGKAKTAKTMMGIQTGKLTSLFDVRGLSAGLNKLGKACG